MSRGRHDSPYRIRSVPLTPVISLLIMLVTSRAEAQLALSIDEITMNDDAPSEASEEVVAALLEGLSDSVRVVCDSPPCDESLGEELVLSVSFSQVGQFYEISATLRRPEGAQLGRRSEVCEVCSWSEALNTTRGLGEELRALIPEPMATTATPDNSTSPPNEATITPEATPQRRSDPLALWGWLSLGAGVAALIPGVIWLAYDGRCALGSDLWNDICVDVYDTEPQGIALTIVSAALISASIVLVALWATGRRHRRSSPTASPPLFEPRRL